MQSLSTRGGGLRRLATGVTLVLALVLVIGAVAAAAPPCDKKPDHPDCAGATTTTVPTAVPACAPDESGQISLSGTGTVRFECLWTPTESTTDVGTVTVEATEGSISGVVVFVRDDSPGDICVLEQDWADQTGASYTASFDLSYGPLTEPFSVYSNQAYWTWDAGHWCFPQDGDFDMRDDSNGKPLHLQVNFRAKKGTTVEITLSPPQATTP